MVTSALQSRRPFELRSQLLHTILHGLFFGYYVGDWENFGAEGCEIFGGHLIKLP